MASAMFHLLVLLMLLRSPLERRGGAHPRSQLRLPVISFALEPQPPSPPAIPKAAAPKEKPDPSATTPKSAAAAHKPVAQPRREPTAASAAPPAPKVPDEAEEMDDVLGRIHDNWLEPPAASKNFRCRMFISYTADGMISGLRVLQGCGSPALDDSVKRAIWKTQPLPVSGSHKQGGSLEIDFTP